MGQTNEDLYGDVEYQRLQEIEQRLAAIIDDLEDRLARLENKLAGLQTKEADRLNYLHDVDSRLTAILNNMTLQDEYFHDIRGAQELLQYAIYM